MKKIDWREVSSNSDLSKNFAIQVFNKFQSLSTSEIDSDNVEEVYSNLIKSTEEVAPGHFAQKEDQNPKQA